MSKDYIDLSEVEKNYVDRDYDPEENAEWVYQFQPKTNTNTSLIMGVGKFERTEL